MTIRLVDREWEAELFRALAADSSLVRIMSPFIKASVIERLLDHEPTKLQVITRFKLADFAACVSDISALQKLQEVGARVRGIKNLHAKLYIFGSTRAIVTSANLTEAGLNRNLEFGIVSEDAATVDACQDYFAKQWEKARDIQHHEINDWVQEIEEWQLRGGRSNDTKRFGDYGADIGLAAPPRPYAPGNVSATQQAFVVFLGRSEYRERARPTKLVLDEIREKDCHWGLARREMPEDVQEGAVVYIGRFARNPDDIRVFGRAIGMKHECGKHDATDTDKAKVPWRKDYPHFIRVRGAEFIDGMMENGVSLKALMRSLGNDAFASTHGKTNTAPHNAYRRRSRVELSSEGHKWLERHLQAAFQKHNKVSESELDDIGWPDSA